MSNNRIPSFAARQLAIYFTRSSSSTTIVNANAQVTQSQSSTTFQVSNVTIVAILGAIGLYASGKLEHLGSFLGKIMGRSNTYAAAADQVQLCIVLANFTDDDIDVSKALDNLKTLDWKDETGKLVPNFVLTDVSGQDQGVLFNYRKARSKALLTQRTIYMLATKTDRDDAVAQLLVKNPFNATAQGDSTGSGGEDPEAAKWAKGLINRMTTGGPNGSMAGKIAVNFMNTVPVAAATFAFTPQRSSNVFLDTSSPLGTILKDAVVSAAQAAAQGLADYLKTLNKPKTAADDDTSGDHQTATIVKGIKDSMPATGRSVAQLAVFNALGNKAMAPLPQDEQLRIAYTVANATRTAVEATGNHIADLYQSGSIPEEHELAAAGVGGILDFLKTVGTTIANGVIQAAPVVFNAIANSSNATNALGSIVPPKVSAANVGLHELDTPTKITMAARIVNGTPNPDSNVVSDKAVSDLADRQSVLGAQAALDTFSSSNDPNPSPEKRNSFRDIALEVANISPTLSNVTDIGATNLVTDSNLKHADSLRQHALEMGIRSCANIIADHPTAEALYKVHQVQLKNGALMAPRGFLDFLKSAVPIAANIAKAAAPALLALI